jgi:hypothetical protein
MQLFPKFGIASKCRPPLPRRKSRKIEKKSRQKPTRYRVFAALGSGT